MSEQVWVSEGHSDTRRYINFRDIDERATLQERTLRSRLIRRGEAVDKTKFPTRLMLNEPPHLLPKKIPELFITNQIYISQKIMDLFNQFDTGRNHFFRVDLFDKDGNELSEMPYFGIAFEERKQTVSGGDGVLPTIGNEQRFDLECPLKDDAVEVFEDIADVPDLWVDPKVEAAVFFSDRLWEAVREAKLTRSFSVRKCRMVKGN